MNTPLPQDDRRSSARRTSLWLGLIAAAFYGMFILMTAFGR